jgi:hypothetical protein
VKRVVVKKSSNKIKRNKRFRGKEKRRKKDLFLLKK